LVAELRVRSLEEAEVHARVHEQAIEGLEDRVRYLEKLIDTRDSWWWKRLKWRLWDGYPPWYRVGPPRGR
jgi:hypothetical protein